MMMDIYFGGITICKFQDLFRVYTNLGPMSVQIFIKGSQCYHT